MKITKKVVKEVSAFCCTQMEAATDARAIQFPNLESSGSLNRAKIFGPRDSRIAGMASNFEIQWCPFCGEKIVFEES